MESACLLLARYKRSTRGPARRRAASWEPGKHNARHGFLNRSRSIWTIISVARARILHMYVACTDARLDGTYVYTYVLTYVCVLCMLFLSGTPRGLPPRSTGQWLAGSTAPLRSTPALYSALRSLPFPSSFASHSLIFTRCPPLLSYMLYNASPHLIRLFFPSFVRVTLAVSSPAFRRLQCATAPLFSSPLSVPIRFLSLFRSRPHPRQDTRALLSFPRLRPFPVPIRRVSTVNRYFRSNAFRLSIAVSSLLHVQSTCSSAKFPHPSFFFQIIGRSVNLNHKLITYPMRYTSILRRLRSLFFIFKTCFTLYIFIINAYYSIYL